MRATIVGNYHNVKLAIDNSRDVHKMRKTRDTREKKGHAWHYVKIICKRFAIQLFSSTIILFLIAWENPFVSCTITSSTTRQFETQDMRNLSCEAAEKIRNNWYMFRVSHVFLISQIVCSWLKRGFTGNSHRHFASVSNIYCFSIFYNSSSKFSKIFPKNSYSNVLTISIESLQNFL